MAYKTIRLDFLYKITYHFQKITTNFITAYKQIQISNLIYKIMYDFQNFTTNFEMAYKKETELIVFNQA